MKYALTTINGEIKRCTVLEYWEPYYKVRYTKGNEMWFALVRPEKCVFFDSTEQASEYLKEYGTHFIPV